MSTDGQGTKWRRNISENFNRLSRVHQRYRQTTDGRTMTYRELEFTFAKNDTLLRQVAQLSQRDRAAGWVSYGQKWKVGERGLSWV